jgi:hypothetical protein
MLATLLSTALGATAMLDAVVVCEKGPGATAVAPGCAPVLAVYARYLAIVDHRTPDSLTVHELKQDLVPGRVLLASGWADGGHRQLERLVLHEVGGALEVVWAAPTPKSEDGEHQLLADVSLSGLEPFFAMMKSREEPHDFTTVHAAFTAQLRSWRAELVATLGPKPSKAKLVALTGLLLAVLEKTKAPRALTSLADLPSKALRGLLSGKPAGRAEWVSGPRAFEPLTVTTTSVKGLVHGDDDRVLHVALTLEAGGFTLERQFVAFERHFIE